MQKSPDLFIYLFISTSRHLLQFVASKILVTSPGPYLGLDTAVTSARGCRVSWRYKNRTHCDTQWITSVSVWVHGFDMVSAAVDPQSDRERQTVGRRKQSGFLLCTWFGKSNDQIAQLDLGPGAPINGLFREKIEKRKKKKEKEMGRFVLVVLCSVVAASALCFSVHGRLGYNSSSL